MYTQSADVSSRRVCDTVVSCCSVPDLQEYLTTKLQFSKDNIVVTIHIWWTSYLQHILVMQGFWVQFGAHFSVIVHGFNWRDALRSPSAIAELLFIFSYKIDWFGCGFFMSSCVCWGCLLMLCSSRPSVNCRRFTWFTWTVCVCWLHTLFHQIKGPCTIQES